MMKNQKDNKIRKPSQITLDLTDRCQLQCVTCSKWHTSAADVIGKELTTNEWKSVILNIRDWLGEGASFWFSGGEPFLRDDIFELASYAKSLGLHAASMTNGYSIRHLTELIVDSDIETISISLNAVNDPEIHNASRGRKDAFEKTMEAILSLKKIREEKGGRLNISIATIIFPENLEEIIPLAEFTKKNGLTGIMFQIIDDVDAFHSFYEHKCYDTEHYRMPDALKNQYQKMSVRGGEIISQLMELKKEGYVIYNTFEQLEAMRTFLKDPDRIVRKIPCDVADTGMGIDPYGEVRLCFNMSPVGNVKDEKMEEIWKGSNACSCRAATKNCKMYCRLLNCNFDKSHKSLVHRAVHKGIRILKGYRM